MFPPSCGKRKGPGHRWRCCLNDSEGFFGLWRGFTTATGAWVKVTKVIPVLRKVRRASRRIRSPFRNFQTQFRVPSSSVFSKTTTVCTSRILFSRTSPSALFSGMRRLVPDPADVALKFSPVRDSSEGSGRQLSLWGVGSGIGTAFVWHILCLNYTS